MTATSQAVQKLLEEPAMAVPPGLKQNFVDPPNLETEFHVDLNVCLIVSVLAVCIRMWTKVCLIRKVQIEDYICILALAVFAGYCGIIFHAIQVGDVGAHQWNVQLRSFSRQLYLMRVAATTYGFVILPIKIAILLQYLRIFSIGRDRLFWVYHILIWLHVLFYLICAFLEIFSCNPVKKFWKPWIEEGQCLDVKAINISAASFNSVSDISILIMPQKLIWNLQMSFKNKIGISMVFLTGGFACIASVIRLYFSAQLSTSNDVNYYVGLMGLWTLPEMASAFLAMCLPVFPKFFRSLKGPYSFSWIVIAHRYLSRSPGRAGYQPTLDHPVPLTYQPKKSSLWPTKKDSPVHTPTGFETENLHIMPPIQTSTTNQSGDTAMQSFTKSVSTGW